MQPEKEKALIEEKLKVVTTEKAPVAGAGSGQNRNARAIEEALLSRLGRDALATPSRNISGAAAAAGVLTAVDEDAEGDEEAEAPHDFDYYTEEEEDD